SRDLARLAAEWRAARPFPHVIVDDLLPVDALDELRQAVAREPHQPNRSELYEMMASSEPMRQPALATFAAAFGCDETLGAVAAITGTPVAAVRCAATYTSPGAISSRTAI